MTRLVKRGSELRFPLLDGETVGPEVRAMLLGFDGLTLEQED